MKTQIFINFSIFNLLQLRVRSKLLKKLWKYFFCLKWYLRLYFEFETVKETYIEKTEKSLLVVFFSFIEFKALTYIKNLIFRLFLRFVNFLSNFTYMNFFERREANYPPVLSPWEHLYYHWVYNIFKTGLSDRILWRN